MDPDPGLKSRKWQTYRTTQLTTHAQHHTPCALCGHPINYTLPGSPPKGHRGPWWGPTIDHITARAIGGNTYDPTNTQPAHHHCNSLKGARLGGRRTAQRRRPTTPSRQW